MISMICYFILELVRNQDDKSKDLHFDHAFDRHFLKAHSICRPQFFLAYSSDPFGGNSVSDFLSRP